MIELTEDGYIQLKIGNVEKCCDLYAVNNEIFEIARQTQGQPLGTYHDALAAMLERLGYPRCSHRLVVLVEQKISEVVADLKKKDTASRKPSSPVATGPVSSEPTPAPSTA